VEGGDRRGADLTLRQEGGYRHPHAQPACEARRARNRPSASRRQWRPERGAAMTMTDDRRATGEAAREIPAAYAEALAGGVVDLMMGVPKSVAEAPRKYDFLDGQLRDRESREEFLFPAQYMFKDFPRYDEIEDPVELVVAECRRFGIRKAMLGVTTNDDARRAVREHSDLFFASWEIDPNTGMDGIGQLVEAVRDLGVRAATFFPAGKHPQVPINDKKAYPFYAKCIELDIPIFVCAGVPGPRVPMMCQHVELLDEVCWFFPELKLVTRHGCEPWTALAAKLLLKWPNLYYSTSAFAPRHYPADIVEFANTRGAGKVMYAGYYPAGLSLDRIFDDMPRVPLRDHVWPKFLRENAMALFGFTEEDLA
jgi:predicted TIM-barrel fold metal-dependent hydrolase